MPELRQNAAQLQALAREAGELARQAPVQVAPMSRDSIDASLKARGLAPQSLSLTGEYARVQLNGVPFASVMLWLDGLRREGRVAVQDAKITAQAQGKAGLVDASLTLHQSPGAAR